MNKRFLYSFLITALFVLGASTNASAQAVKYIQKITHGGNQVAVFNVILKGEKSRTESNAAGMQTIMIKNEKGAFSYRPAQNMAVKVPMESMGDMPDTMTGYRAHLKESGATKIGEETLGIYDCEIYEYQEPSTGQTAKAWVWKDEDFPVRVEVLSSDATMVIEFQDIQVGVDVPDTAFELPESTEVIDMQALMHQ